MAKNRRGDRVDNSHTGGVQYNTPNRMLPRMSDRDYKATLYSGLLQAVIPNVPRRAEVRMPARRLPILPFKRARIYPNVGRPDKPIFVGSFPAKQDFLVDLPYRARVCVRRKQRREVLFAFRRAGYAGSAPKRRYRRTSYSKYGC